MTMEKKDLKTGMRVWHPIFLWGTMQMPPNDDKSLVEFDFMECTYYVMGEGYKTFRNDETKGNVIYLPNDQLYDKEIDSANLPYLMNLKKVAMNATIVL